MLITLAYPFDGHDPDDTIDVDAATGRRLIRDGRARAAATPDADTAPDDPTRVDPDPPAPGDNPKEADSGR